MLQTGRNSRQCTVPPPVQPTSIALDIRYRRSDISTTTSENTKRAALTTALLRESERDGDVQSNRNRLIIKVGGLVLPTANSIHSRLDEKRRTRNNFHFDDVALFVDDGVDDDSTAHVGLFRESGIDRVHARDEPRLLDASAHADGCLGFEDRSDGLGDGGGDATNHAADDSTDRAAGNSARDTTDDADGAFNVGGEGLLLNHGDLLGNNRGSDQFACIFKGAPGRSRADDSGGGGGRRSGRGRGSSEKCGCKLMHVESIGEVETKKDGSSENRRVDGEADERVNETRTAFHAVVFEHRRLKGAFLTGGRALGWCGWSAGFW